MWVFSDNSGPDWMVFDTAARAYFDGNLPLIFDGEALTAYLGLVSPLFNPPSVFRAGSLTPVLILLLLAALIAEIREDVASTRSA